MVRQISGSVAIYTPASNYNGLDEISYEVSDGN